MPISNEYRVILDKLQSIELRLTDIEETANATKDVVDAWDALKTGSRFVKWAGALAASIGVLWAAVKTGLHFDGVIK